MASISLVRLLDAPGYIRAKLLLFVPRRTYPQAYPNDVHETLLRVMTVLLRSRDQVGPSVTRMHIASLVSLPRRPSDFTDSRATSYTTELLHRRFLLGGMG